ncbi:MAG TPA: hypothetical protein VGR48_17445 [Terriglobales bacterium]|nr:hypothetical protein [Terriglobales bacterium]
MKRYAVIALMACIAFVTLAATPGNAQVLMKADVPFNFCVGYGTLPAGQYTLSRIGLEQSVLLSAGQRGAEIMLPRTIESRSDIRSAKLVFHRYGDEYFLSEIWTNADDSVRTLSVHPRERQLAKAGVSPQVAVIYAVLPPASGN